MSGDINEEAVARVLADRLMPHVRGLFAGQLSEDESEAVAFLVKHRQARYVYEGGAGFMGLAKVGRP